METCPSINLQPGTRLRHTDGDVVTLARRKGAGDDHRGLAQHPGWWLAEGGGLADSVIDHPQTEWSLIDGCSAEVPEKSRGISGEHIGSDPHG